MQRTDATHIPSEDGGTPTLLALSRAFIGHFYHHDTLWCLSVCSPDVSLLGSTADLCAHGAHELEQVMRTTLTRYYQGVVSPIETEVVWFDQGTTAVVLARFLVASDPTSGHVVARQNRATLVWNLSEHDGPAGQAGIAGNAYRLRHIHLSTQLWATDADTDPKGESRETYRYAKALLDQLIRRAAVSLRDVDGSVHYVSAAEVVYVEASKQRTAVHCVDKTILVRRGFKDLVSVFGGQLVPIHRSFAVNPLHVRTVRGDTVVMDNGSEVPLPQRRSSEVRHQLDAAVRRTVEARVLKETPPPNLFL